MTNKTLSVMIVGQKWLAERLLAWCLTQPAIKVVAVSPPKNTDRLARLATTHQIPIAVHDKTLTADQVPTGVDTHAYCFVEKRARDKARLGAVGRHPSLLPKYKGKTPSNSHLIMATRLWAVHSISLTMVGTQGRCWLKSR